MNKIILQNALNEYQILDSSSQKGTANAFLQCNVSECNLSMCINSGAVVKDAKCHMMVSMAFLRYGKCNIPGFIYLFK